MQQYVCSKPWCGKTFTKIFNFTRHESSCRRPSKSYLCKNKFSKVPNLRRYIELHSKKKFKPKNINKKKSNQ